MPPSLLHLSLSLSLSLPLSHSLSLSLALSLSRARSLSRYLPPSFAHLSSREHDNKNEMIFSLFRFAVEVVKCGRRERKKKKAHVGVGKGGAASSFGDAHHPILAKDAQMPGPTPATVSSHWPSAMRRRIHDNVYGAATAAADRLRDCSKQLSRAQFHSDAPRVLSPSLSVETPYVLPCTE